MVNCIAYIYAYINCYAMGSFIFVVWNLIKQSP